MKIESYSYDGSEESKKTYEMLKSWAPEDFSIPGLIPKLGVIVYEDDQALVFMAADMSNSIPRAIIDSLQTNPAVPAMKRFRAVKLAESFLCKELKRLGYSLVVAHTKIAGVACLSQNCGYCVVPEGVSVVYKSIA